MDKLRKTTLEVLPYAELVLKPADTRPITISIYDPPDAPKVSDGNADDMAEVIQVLGVMRMMCLVKLNARLKMEAREVRVDRIIAEGDEELPF